MVSRYARLIEFAKKQTLSGYSEKHHIIPKSLGGTDEPDNIVCLTPRQHYVAHWILWKIHGSRMTTAFNFMNGLHRYGKRLNRRTTSKLKEEEIERQRNKEFSIETRQKMRKAKLGRKLSPEHIEKVRQTRIGKPLSDDWKLNVSKAKSGKGNGREGAKLSEETKRKIIESNFKRPMITCPHCLKTMKDHGGAKRWHFDRCKERKEAA